MVYLMTKPNTLGCQSAIKLPPSTSTIAVSLIIIQPKSWYSFIVRWRIEGWVVVWFLRHAHGQTVPQTCMFTPLHQIRGNFALKIASMACTTLPNFVMLSAGVISLWSETQIWKSGSSHMCQTNCIDRWMGNVKSDDEPNIVWPFHAKFCRTKCILLPTMSQKTTNWMNLEY